MEDQSRLDVLRGANEDGMLTRVGKLELIELTRISLAGTKRAQREQLLAQFEDTPVLSRKGREELQELRNGVVCHRKDRWPRSDLSSLSFGA